MLLDLELDLHDFLLLVFPTIFWYFRI
jgi:hypothetical protein